MSRAKKFLIITIISVATTQGVFSQDSNVKYLTDSVPLQWSYTSTFTQTNPTTDLWWKSFNDPCLDSLITMGVSNNYNLQMVERRIGIARNAVKATQSGYYPQVAIDAGWTKNRISGISENPAMINEYFSLGLNMSWQVDLFGQIRKQVQEKKELWNASKSQYDGAMIALCGNIATAYTNLRMRQTQYNVAMYHLQSQKKVSEMTEARFKSGLSSMLDVSQAQTVYFNTLSSLPELKAMINTQINAIAILVGEYPQNVVMMLERYSNIPDYRQIVSVGVPMELLRRRPDIKEAEYNLASLAASVGIAKKEFLPVLSINGSVGFDSHDIKDMFKSKSFNYAIQPQLTWTIFDGLKRNYDIVTAKEQMMIGIDNYNITVMTAYQDVENAMINYKYALQSIDALNVVMAESQKSLELSIDLYKKGLSAFTNVLNSQLSLLQYNNSLITAQGKAALSLINLYEALGGGWEKNNISKQ